MPADHSHILQTAFGFWSSKVLLTAVELDVFTTLGDRGLTGEQLGTSIGIHPLGIWDFFDALVATGFLDRDGTGKTATYRNTEATATFLVKDSPRYVGGILTMLNARLFKYWDDLPEALRTGKPQNEIKHSQKSIFEELYADLPRLEQFLGGMTGPTSRSSRESSTSGLTRPSATWAGRADYSRSSWRSSIRT